MVLVIFSTIRLTFPPFNDDLGTMPTRRPYSWKKSVTTTVTDVPSVQKWRIARMTNMASTSMQKTVGISSALGSLATSRLESNLQATSKHLGTKWATVAVRPSSRRGKLLVGRGVHKSHQASPTAPALWVVAVGRSLVGASAHNHHLLVTWAL